MLSSTHPISSSPPAAGLRVVESCRPDDWHAYIEHRLPGALFHRLEWDAVFAVYGLRTLRLAALRDDRVVGVLPLVLQKSPLTGRQLVSLPWFDAAGIVADDPEVALALADSAIARAQTERVPTVQLRQPAALDWDHPVRTDKVLMRLPLPDDSEALWNQFSPKVRNQVRKAEKSGLSAELGGGELLDDFFRIYAHNMRDLGSPSHHRRFFAAVLDAFPAETTLFVVRKDQAVIGAAWSLANGEILELPWASSLKRYNPLCVNHLLYWTILQHACRRRYQMFHFGRSTRDSGTFHFKKQWGAEPVPLFWYYLSAGGAAPAAAMSPDESFGWGTRLWQRLPVWLTTRLGPRLIAGIP
jgi:FemAB-related protein (PEP-CTERM system-associated)